MEERNFNPILYLVLPCFNEEEVIKASYEKLRIKFSNLILKNTVAPNSHIVFVDDGSYDSTWSILQDICERDSLVAAIKLSKNEGHQNAILAGMLSVKDVADVVITMDVDLQQDIEAIDCFLESYHKGNEIVYGIRNSRSTDSFYKKLSAKIFYKSIGWLSAGGVIENHADYRLMSSKALNALAEFKEVNLFLRGIIPLIGFQSDIIYFDVYERTLGKSKYTLKKMLKLALDGVTSLSIKPVRIITMTGVIVSLISAIMLLYTTIMYFIGDVVHGWASTLCSIWFIGGMQLLSIGIVGEYIGKTYLESKSRPTYIIEEFIWDENEKKD